MAATTATTPTRVAKTPVVTAVAEPRGLQAILSAMTQMRQGEAGDLRAVTEGLSTLRHLGLEDVARRSALQLVLLKRML